MRVLPTVVAGETAAVADAASLPTDVPAGSLRYVTDEGAIYAYNGVSWGSVVSGDINLASQVTGTLPISNGGTGSSTGAPLPPVGSIIAYFPGYYGNSSNGSFTPEGPAANTVVAVNAYLPDNWRVCSGAELNDPDSPIFSGAGRYLPNLTDTRFLHGSTTAGDSGGVNAITIAEANLPAHTHGVGTLAAAGESAHTHSISITSGSQSADHTHSFTTGTESVSHSHSFGGNVVRGNNQYTAGNGGTLVGGVVDSASTISGTNTQSANHTHSGTTGGMSVSHTHLVSGTSAAGSSHTHTLSGATASTGGGTSIDILPRYVACFYIIRVK